MIVRVDSDSYFWSIAENSHIFLVFYTTHIISDWQIRKSHRTQFCWLVFPATKIAIFYFICPFSIHEVNFYQVERHLHYRLRSPNQKRRLSSRDPSTVIIASVFLLYRSLETDLLDVHVTLHFTFIFHHQKRRAILAESAFSTAHTNTSIPKEKRTIPDEQGIWFRRVLFRKI